MHKQVRVCLERAIRSVVEGLKKAGHDMDTHLEVASDKG
jgi:hypothetical protein